MLVERAPYAGAKNMYGGVIYSHAASEIFPNYKEAPIERYISKHNYVLLSDEDSTEISYKNPSHEECAFVAIRAKWDKWCVQEAVKEGVYFAPDTLVKELIVKDGKVVGITTDVEDFYADVVIIADGVNSLLARQIGLREDIKPKNVALAVKEVIRLAPEVKRRHRLRHGTCRGAACTNVWHGYCLYKQRFCCSGNRGFSRGLENTQSQTL